MLSDNFTTEFVVRRAVWAKDGEDNDYSTEQLVGTFLGHIQQTQAELVQDLGLSLTNAYKVLCPVNTNVLAGDTIESNEGMYSVKAIKKVAIGLNPHLVLIAQQDNVSGS